MYSPSTDYYTKPRYYIQLGAALMHFLGYDVLESNYYLTPFNPFLMKGVKNYALDTAVGRENFVEFMGLIAPPPLRELYGDDPFKYAIDELYGSDPAPLRIIRSFLLDYFFPKYWYSRLANYADDDKESALINAYMVWFNHFAEILSATAKKYLILISALQTKENALLDRLQSTTNGFSKFNDTPQGSGDFSGDTHATNVTNSTTTTSTDYDTPIKRLREIRDNLEVYYNAWASDFDKLFVRISEDL